MKILNGVAVLAALGALAAGGAVHAQTTWTVCQDGSCDFTDIQSAIDASVSGDTILVASGTYLPPATIRNDSKQIHLIGATGALGLPATVLDGNGKFRLMELDGPDVTIENIEFYDGFSPDRGGALYLAADSNPTIINCRFINNSTSDLGGAVSSLLSTPTFDQCHFEGNLGGTNGGALYLIGSYTTFIRCTITANTSPYGSGIFLAGGCACVSTLIDTIVCGNVNTTGHPLQILAAGDNTWTADADSCVEADCNACIPVQWRVDEGGNGHWYRYLNEPRYWTDWNNVAMQMGGHLATLTTDEEATFISTAFPSSLRFCLGGYQDLNAPTYSEPAGGWRWVTEEPWSFESWTPGEPNNAAGGFEHYLERVNGAWNDIPNTVGRHALIEWSADCNGDGIVDYGQILDGTLEDANGNGVPDCCDEGVLCAPCPADVNEDGVVNGADISAVLGFWGQAGKPLPAADITQDGIVNGADIAVLLGNWGPCQ